MAKMILFTHSDCKTELEQKNLLLDAGNDIQCRDLKTQKWTRESLLPFVRGRSPVSIMNCRAAEITSGKIDPVLLTFEEALALMVESPDLIRGPLVAVDGLYIQGTEDRRLNKYLGSAVKKSSQTQKKSQKAPSLQRIIWDYWQNLSQTANQSPA